MSRSTRAIAFLSAILLPGVTFAGPACPIGLPTDGVSMMITSSLQATVPSAEVGFEVELQNAQDVLISDAAIAVDVVRKSSGEVVDRFESPQRITLFAESTGKATFAWTVPTYLSSDTYTLIATLLPAGITHAQARSALPVPRAEIDMAVQSEAEAVTIGAISVNDDAYTHRRPVRIGESTEITASIANATDGPYRGEITWRLYAAESDLAAEPIDTQTMRIELHPGASTEVQYTLRDTSHQGYYLEGTLSNGRTASYIDVWLSRSNDALPGVGCGGLRLFSESGPSNTTVVIGVVALILVLGGAWKVWERRRAQG